MLKEFIDAPDMHSFVYENDNKYDVERAALVCTWEDPNDDEVYFSYPTIDGSGFTVSISPKLQVWSMHDYWRTAASQGELWAAPILLSPNGDIWVQSSRGAGSSFASNPLGFSDMLSIPIGYGDAAYGEQPYGGKVELD